MPNRSAQRSGIGKESYLLGPAGQEISCMRFGQGTVGHDAASRFNALDNQLADGVSDFGVPTFATVEPLSPLDQDF